MNKTRQMTMGKIGFVLFASLAGALIGCVGYVGGPRGGGEVYVQDDYVYYPGYQIYYSDHTHHYIYQDGHSWVRRPEPPRVSVNVLQSSPSVRLDFHDHPSNHHAKVARQYPKNWKPPGSSQGRKEGHNDHNQDEH